MEMFDLISILSLGRLSGETDDFADICWTGNRVRRKNVPRSTANDNNKDTLKRFFAWESFWPVQLYILPVIMYYYDQRNTRLFRVDRTGFFFFFIISDYSKYFALNISLLFLNGTRSRRIDSLSICRETHSRFYR